MKRTFGILLTSLLLSSNIALSQAITDTGTKVGIGTTTPTQQLSIKATRPRLVLTDNAGDAGVIEFHELTNEIRLQKWLNFGAAHNRTIMALSGDNGYVSIGSGTPEAGLHFTSTQNQTNTISDGIGFLKTLGSDYNLQITSSGGNPHLDFANETNEDYDIRLGVWNNNKLAILGGHVGIGTQSPTQNLSIQAVRPRFVLAENSGNAGVIEFNEATNQIRLQKWNGFGANYDKTMMILDGDNGYVGIGTTEPKSELSVNGQIRATEVKVLADISVPDYVFEPDYELRTLQETKEYVIKNKHLPEIPSAAEIGENGIDLGEMNMKLLKKIEELTLYQIELMEKLEEQQKRIEKLENK